MKQWLSSECAHTRRNILEQVKKYITDYESVFQRALSGDALDIFNEARSKYVFSSDY